MTASFQMHCNSSNSKFDSHLLSKNVKIRIYRTIILPMVLYGYETLSLTLRKAHRLRVFDNWPEER
jgi:hypothetical protein